MLEHSPETAFRTETMLKTALGPQIGAALADPDVVEVMANADGAIWTDSHGHGRQKTGARLSPQVAERVVRVVASAIGEEVTREKPFVSAELPGKGERFEGLLPPVATAPVFAIRKHANKIYTLDDYVAAGVISAPNATLLRKIIKHRLSILIVGGTGSGKTTLANALLHEVAKTSDRVVILEDTRELQCPAEDCVALRTHGRNVLMADLVRSTLRLRPDRIVVGEVRGGEALDLLKAWNTGHPGGIATIHGSSGLAGLLRLEQLCAEVSATNQERLISQAVDFTVTIEGRGGARKVTSILEVGCPGDDGKGYFAPEISEAEDSPQLFPID